MRPQRRSQHRPINGNWSGASSSVAAERCGMTPFVLWRRCGGNSSGMNETTTLFHLRQRDEESGDLDLDLHARFVAIT